MPSTKWTGVEKERKAVCFEYHPKLRSYPKAPRCSGKGYTSSILPTPGRESNQLDLSPKIVWKSQISRSSLLVYFPTVFFFEKLNLDVSCISFNVFTFEME